MTIFVENQNHNLHLQVYKRQSQKDATSSLLYAKV